MIKFRFLEPEMIMSIVVALIVLAVGVFAFFTVISSIDTAFNETKEENTEAQNTFSNISESANGLFDIIGVVLILGAIMAIVVVVYSFVGRDYEPSGNSTSSDYSLTPTPTYDSHRRRQREQEANARAKQRKLEAKKKAEAKKVEQAKLKEKQSYNKGRPSRTSKAARMLDEQEGTKKRRKSK